MNIQPRNRMVFRVFVSAYLIYLGVNTIRNIGEDSGNPVLLIVFGIFFIAVGAAYALFSYKTYKRDQANSEDLPDETPDELPYKSPDESPADAEDSTYET